MPPHGAIRGERVDEHIWVHRPAVVQPPTVRISWPVLLGWWAIKGLALGVVFLAARLWWFTWPALATVGVWWRFGASTLAAGGGVLLVAGFVWWWAHPDTFYPWCWWRLLARWRRWRYRRKWWSAMATAGLVVRFDRHEVVPILRRVTCRRGVDILSVRMVTGQIPEDFAAAAERFVHTFDVASVRVQPGKRPGRVLVTVLRSDPLVEPVSPLPVTARPDFTALPLGVCEDGSPYLLALFGTQVLVAGATGAGKGSVIWSLIRALAGGVASGVVELWGFDPKGGMELGGGLPLFARFACEDFADMAQLLEQAVDVARSRAARLRGHTRQHTPTVAEPLIVLVVDELAALTAYLADRKLKERIRAALSVLLSQGRAVGVHVLAAIQDPRKEVLPFRDLFPTRIGLRLTEASQVDLVLGDGMRERGALCHRIPQHLPGVGYVVLDGDPIPVRVRFSYLTDDDIADLATTYAPGGLRVIDGETVAEPSGPAGCADPDGMPADLAAMAGVPVWREAA